MYAIIQTIFEKKLEKPIWVNIAHRYSFKNQSGVQIVDFGNPKTSIWNYLFYSSLIDIMNVQNIQ
jgi:hypothetical protein